MALSQVNYEFCCSTREYINMRKKKIKNKINYSGKLIVLAPHTYYLFVYTLKNKVQQNLIGL